MNLRKPTWNKYIGVGVSLIVSSSFANNYFNEIGKLENLIVSEQFEKAFTYADSLEEGLAGNSKFDYLYSVAALKTNRADVAVFPLERLIIEQPNQIQSRLELANAYYLLNDLNSTKTQLLSLKEMPLSKKYARNVNNFLNEIYWRNKEKTKSITFRFGIKPGFNTNINSATSANVITYGSLNSQTLELSDNARAQSDFYTESFASVSGILPISKKLSFSLDLIAQDIRNSKHEIFDFGKGRAKGSFICEINENKLIIPLEYEKNLVAHESYRISKNAGFMYSHVLSKMDTLSFGIKYTDLTFYTIKNLSEENYQVNAGWLHGFNNIPFILQANITGVIGKAKVDSAKENVKKEASVNVSFFATFLNSTTPYAQIEIASNSYNASHSVFVLRRNDNRFNLNLGVISKIHENLEANITFSYLKNDSNIPAYEYIQKKYSAGITYVF